MPSNFWGTTKPPAGVGVDPSHPLAQGLVSAWPLNGGLVLDAYGPNHLTRYNGVANGVGRAGGSACADFLSGGSGALSIPDTDGLSVTRAMTLSLWVKMRTHPGNVFVVSKWRVSSNNRSYNITMGNAIANTYGFSISQTGDSTETKLNYGSTSPLGSWYFVVASYDGATMSLIVNDGLEATNAYSGGIFNSIAPFNIASFDGSAGSGVFVNGLVENVCLWNRALTRAEKSALYTQPYVMFAPPVWRRYFRFSTVYTATLTGTVTPAGVLVKSAGSHITGLVTPTGVLVKSPGSHFAGTVTPAGALVKSAGRHLAGTVTPAGALVKQVGQHLSGAVTPVGTLVRSAGKTLAGTVTPAGALVKRAGKTLAGTLTPAGALGTVRQAQVALSGTVAPAGVLALTALAHGSVRVFGGAVNALVTILTTGRQRPDATVQTGDKQSGA